VARIYKYASQHKEALRLFRACLEVGTNKRAEVLRDLVFADIEVADWPRARADLQALEKEGDKETGSLRQAMEIQIPTDG
jgi:hypothetical protein